MERARRLDYFPGRLRHNQRGLEYLYPKWEGQVVKFAGSGSVRRLQLSWAAAHWWESGVAGGGDLGKMLSEGPTLHIPRKGRGSWAAWGPDCWNFSLEHSPRELG